MPAADRFNPLQHIGLAHPDTDAYPVGGKGKPSRPAQAVDFLHSR
jgi:hypothetical protein